MLTHEKEQKYIAERIEHDAFAQPGTKGIVSIEERPMEIPIPGNLWPDGLKPVVKKIKNLAPGSKIDTAIGEHADVLVITYTTDETRALGFVLSGDRDYENNWYKYEHNFDKLRLKITNGMTPALDEGNLGFLLPIQIKDKTVMLFKSELHPARNGKELPILDLVQQLVTELTPGLVITAGTAGAVGGKVKLGDAVITDTSMFLCKHKYPDDARINTFSDNQTPVSNKVPVIKKYVTYANKHFTKLIVPGLEADIAKLKNGKHKIDFLKPVGTPAIYLEKVTGAKAMNVISADYFSVADTKDSEGLEKLGIMNDMDDAFVAFAISTMSNGTKPKWLSIRNASEPEIKFDPSEAKMKDQASAIYKMCGYHTTYNSSFATWAVVSGI